MNPTFIPDPTLGKSVTQGGFMPDPDQSKMALGHSNGLITNALKTGWGALQQVSTGVAQEGTKDILGLGTAALKVGGEIPGALGQTLEKGAQAGQTAMQSPALQSQTGIESAAQTATSLGEFALPAGEIAKGEEAIGLIPKVGGIVKTGLKAGLEALTGGGITYAQTQDPSKAGISALTFGLTKGATGLAGEAAKAIGLPEHLYSTVFKTAANDMIGELKTGGIEALQKEDPALFKKFVDEGIIKTGEGGKVQLDETLAKQALDRGLKGSINNMANVVVKGLLKSESSAREIAKTATEPVKIPTSKNLQNLLLKVASDYENVGQGEMSNKALNLAGKIEETGGNLQANDALTLRRFLDGMRARASYNPQATLSTTGENFKYWSDAVRREINKVPGMKSVMKDYSFNIDALTSLAQTAAKRGNAQLVNMLDVLIFEGGLTGGIPGLGASMSLGRKALQTPVAATRLGSAIKNSGALSKLGSFAKGAMSELFTGGAGVQEPQGPEIQ